MRSKVTTQTTPQQSSITQQLRTDLAWSVGVTTATQLMWLTGLRAQHSHSPQQPCNQKDTHVFFFKLLLYTLVISSIRNRILSPKLTLVTTLTLICPYDFEQLSSEGQYMPN